VKANQIITILAVILAARTALGKSYFVSPTGADSAVGSQSVPFRTIQRAADAVQPGDSVYVAGGVYRETVRIRRSGRKGAPIRFLAAPRETVIMSGVDDLPGPWRGREGQIYTTRVEPVFSQLFFDEQMLIEARWPNMPWEDRWDPETWADTFRPSGGGTHYGTMADPALAETGIDWSGGLAVLNVGSWDTYLRVVENHAPGKDRFNYARDMQERLAIEETVKTKPAGYDHYYLYGKLEALDAPGEWFWDSDTKLLHVWLPDGSSPADHRMQVKRREYGFMVNGVSDVEIVGFDFFGCTFSGEDCERVTIEDCDLRFPTYVKRMTDWEQEKQDIPYMWERQNETYYAEVGIQYPTALSGEHNAIRNCTYLYSDGPVMMSGQSNTLENCLMEYIDWRGLGLGRGVWMGLSKTSILRRNTLAYCGCSEGIQYAWMGPTVVELNYSHHIGYVQSDGACFQGCGTRLNGTVIRHNWAHDHHAYNWGHRGIRGDDVTRDLRVHHNVVFGCDFNGIVLKGNRNDVHHNTSIGNELVDICLTMVPEPHKEWRPENWDVNIPQQNIDSRASNNYAPVFSERLRAQLRNVRVFESLDEVHPGDVQNNYAPRRNMLADVGPVFRDDLPWLNDPGAMDFRPRAGSPLIDAGVVVDDYTGEFLGKAPDVGAYEYGATNYWIPGYQPKQASRPYPPDGYPNAREGTDLMWLGGYRSTQYDVYLGDDHHRVAEADRGAPEYKGRQPNNIFGSDVNSGTRFWRIDSITPNGVVKGDVWSFCAMPNRSPQFKASPTVYLAALNIPLAENLLVDVIDPDPADSLRFAKLSGPDWLTLEPQGWLIGSPGADDLGTNAFRVAVTDAAGAMSEGVLVVVASREPAIIRRPYRQRLDVKTMTARLLRRDQTVDGSVSSEEWPQHADRDSRYALTDDGGNRVGWSYAQYGNGYLWVACVLDNPGRRAGTSDVGDYRWSRDVGWEVNLQTVSQDDTLGPVYVLHGFAGSVFESVTDGGAQPGSAARLQQQVSYASRVTDSGGLVGEFRIPFAALEIPRGRIQKFRFNIGARGKAWSQWAHTGSAAYDLDKAGELVFEKTGNRSTRTATRADDE